jgi:hypothetical protein
MSVAEKRYAASLNPVNTRDLGPKGAPINGFERVTNRMKNDAMTRTASTRVRNAASPPVSSKSRLDSVASTVKGALGVGSRKAEQFGSSLMDRMRGNTKTKGSAGAAPVKKVRNRSEAARKAAITRKMNGK